MTPQELRTQLITILGTELGIFTTRSGKKYPAIWIVPPLVDPSYKVAGLQVAILATPEIQQTQSLTSEKLERRWWIVELAQTDVNKQLQPALDLIEKFYPVTMIRVEPPTRTEYEKARIGIYDPIFAGPSVGYSN